MHIVRIIPAAHLDLRAGRPVTARDGDYRFEYDDGRSYGDGTPRNYADAVLFANGVNDNRRAALAEHARTWPETAARCEAIAASIPTFA